MTHKSKNPKTLEEWAGSRHLGLTLLFTDIVSSTSIGLTLGDHKWIEDLFAHFETARIFLEGIDCYIVKVIGDSLMIAFRTSTEAVDFATGFAIETGVFYIGIRVGINSGQVQIRENDIYGLSVNLTSRIQHSVPGEGIRVSGPVKEDYERVRGKSTEIVFRETEIDLPSFGKIPLWDVDSEDLRAYGHAEDRRRLLETGVPPLRL